MFSDPQFIAASRNFVCVRLESYESEEHQQIIRKFLRGTFQNTAFCILAPDGETRLSQSGRSPSALFGRRGGSAPGEPEDEVKNTLAKLQIILKNYPKRKNDSAAEVQDFHSFRQALNVASGDQRLLLLTVASQQERDKLVPTLQQSLQAGPFLGRFHHDFAEGEGDVRWADLVADESAKKGFVIIRPDSFGKTGQVLAQLPLSATPAELQNALSKANEDYAKLEKRKVYSDHVKEGRRNKVYFENAMPYGEDRDGDGKIDERSRRPSR